MSNLEYISPAGLRIDGRRPNEIRHISFKMNMFPKASGSCYYEQGNTKVIVTVYGPREVQRGQALNDRAIVHCEYSMATFATGERRPRGKGDRRSVEISNLLQKTFESVILIDKYPRTQIDIFAQVIQSDGGTRCACINAATLALIDAGIPLNDFVVACAAGYLNSTPLCDLNFVEDSAGGPDLSVAYLPTSTNLAMVQMDSKVNIEHFEKILQCAMDGAKQIHQILVKRVEERVQELAKKRGLIK